MEITQKIATFLWFNDNAEEAAKFYVSIFKDSKILSVSPMTVTFQLEGQQFIALNGGPQFKFTEAISLFVRCKDQKEVDTLWAKLTADGGAESQCGWLKDKFGLSWQIIPDVLGELLSSKDAARSQRAVAAMMQMRKIDIQRLEQAAAAG
jgi:predicted 3-demethylubiquinone-9 3-methyltransferase (glyoxalase superfamily)